MKLQFYTLQIRQQRMMIYPWWEFFQQFIFFIITSFTRKSEKNSFVILFFSLSYLRGDKNSKIYVISNVDW